MREPEATQTQTLTSRLRNQISFLCYSLKLHQFFATPSCGNSMVRSWAKPSLITCQSRSPKPSIPQGSKAPTKQSWDSRPWLNRNHIFKHTAETHARRHRKMSQTLPWTKSALHSQLQNCLHLSSNVQLWDQELWKYIMRRTTLGIGAARSHRAIPIGSMGFISLLGAGNKEQWNLKTIEASTKPAKPNKKWMLL